MLAWLGGTFTPGPVKERLLGWLNDYGELITGLLPTGWLIGPGHRWLTGAGHPSDWLWLLLPLGLGSWLPPSLCWLGRNFHFREAVLLDYASEAPEGLSDEDRQAFSGQLEPPPKVGVTDATDRILSRDFLAPAAAPTSGWIERQVWRWWTPRQRLLAEWDWAAEPGWTSAWKTGSLLLGGSVLVTLLGRALGWVFLEWALPVGGGLGGLILLPFWIALSGGRLQSGASQPVRLSEFGLMPRGMGETLALVTKASLVRILAAMPVVVPYGTVVALMLDRPWWVGADFGLRACFVAGAITPVLLVTRVAKTTNDIRLGRFRALLVLGWHLACLTLLGTALVAGFMADAGWWFLAAAPLVGRLWERGYRWALDRLWFDLLRRD